MSRRACSLRQTQASSVSCNRRFLPRGAASGSS
jgi:hypothetical protein